LLRLLRRRRRHGSQSGYPSTPASLSIYLSTYLPVHPSIYLSIYLPIYLPTYLSINPSIYLSIYSHLSIFIDGSYTKGKRAHTHRELIRELLWEPTGSSLNISRCLGGESIYGCRLLCGQEAEAPRLSERLSLHARFLIYLSIYISIYLLIY